ncbi:peroxisome assembly protein 26 [Bombina bombina]|uniref:peroxisome assembly protein 26 n=1 Tax=Bombina bombina TaxID=8345 RepID=UPI00235A55D3|nr:peroxisome assembly protein 26 [Bombina bombina]XP_053574880.1 peroxisome assembly protein 26 [Bombina bombina]XP_053574881.1 peroxisome assembly protein 26 [Bombina bombina]
MAVSQNVSSISLSAMWDWSLSGTPTAMSILDAAADFLVLERNFAGALDLCERGLQIIAAEPGDIKCEQIKTSLCVIGIQALAELERWREVLPWLLQYYTTPQELPHNIMGMCLLLYSRVKQQHVMLELSTDWLREQSNQQLPGYARVLELHLLRILLPLGLFSEAEELAQNSQVFTGQQKHTVLKALSENRTQWEQLNKQNTETLPSDHTELKSKLHTDDTKKRLLKVTRLLYGVLSIVWRQIHKVPLRQVVLALLLITLVLFRLDPASPMAQGPMSHIRLMLQECISNVFQASSASRS